MFVVNSEILFIFFDLVDSIIMGMFFFLCILKVVLILFICGIIIFNIIKFIFCFFKSVNLYIVLEIFSVLNFLFFK